MVPGVHCTDRPTPPTSTTAPSGDTAATRPFTLAITLVLPRSPIAPTLRRRGAHPRPHLGPSSGHLSLRPCAGGAVTRGLTSATLPSTAAASSGRPARRCHRPAPPPSTAAA